MEAVEGDHCAGAPSHNPEPSRRWLGFAMDSMDQWLGLREKSTGNHRFSHEIWGFPVNFPLNQSIDHEHTGIMVQLKSESFLYDGHRTICCLPPLSDVDEIPEEVPVVFRFMRNKGKKSSWEAEGYQSSEGRLRILDCFREIFWPNSGSMTGRIRPVCMSTSLNTAVWTNTK